MLIKKTCDKIEYRIGKIKRKTVKSIDRHDIVFENLELADAEHLKFILSIKGGIHFHRMLRNLLWLVSLFVSTTLYITLLSIANFDMHELDVRYAGIWIPTFIFTFLFSTIPMQVFLWKIDSKTYREHYSEIEKQYGFKNAWVHSRVRGDTRELIPFLVLPFRVQNSLSYIAFKILKMI